MKIRIILIFCFLFLLKGASCFAQNSEATLSSVDKTNAKLEWVKFLGESTKKGRSFLLTTPSGEIFAVSKNDVKFEKDSVYLKINSKVNPIHETATKTKALIDCKCPVKILATNREERIPKYGCDTKCWGVVLFCTDCVYNPAGVFIKEETKICGGCIGLPF